MATTRANWFLDAVIPPEDVAAPPTSIEGVGEKIDLDPKVHQERLVALTRREADLYNTGVRCALKQDMEDGCCHACPMRREGADDPMTELCGVGLDQEKALTALAVLRWNGTTRDG